MLLPNAVALVTTMWDLVHLKTGESREKELMEDDEFWAPALKRGTSIQRHNGSKESAMNAILSLLSAQVASQSPLHLDSQPDVRSAHQSDCHFIAVMGPVGSGKSTFINLASKSKLKVGNGLKSCTAEVIPTAPFLVGDKWVVLLDAPGFEDTKTSDFDSWGKLPVICRECTRKRSYSTAYYSSKTSPTRG